MASCIAYLLPRGVLLSRDAIKSGCFAETNNHRTIMPRTYAFLALLLPLVSACYHSQCFTKADIGRCVPLFVNQLSMEYNRYLTRVCIPLYNRGLDGARIGLICVQHGLDWVHYKCRARFGNKCVVYLGVLGLGTRSCNPTVTVEGIALGQWVYLNRRKKSGICPLQFKFPGISKGCAPPRKAVAGKA